MCVMASEWNASSTVPHRLTVTGFTAGFLPSCYDNLETRVSNLEADSNQFSMYKVKKSRFS